MKDTRLQKYLSSCGICSRRKAEELILDGKISINGEICKILGTKIDIEKDEITYENKVVKSRNKHAYIMLNKPEGVTCTLHDYHAETTITELLPNIPHLYPVGRLDKNSEGLILVTTDGEFANQIMHPKYVCEKEYLVISIGNISENHIEQMKKGIMLTDEESGKEKRAKIAAAKITKKEHGRTYLAITLQEGQKRQIRRMFQKFGFTVQYLKRVRIGAVSLGKLPKGEWRNLTSKEILSLTPHASRP